MNKLLKKPKQPLPSSQQGRYERFYLTENPFPTEPVNKDSSDRRINGEIYEKDIRVKEYTQIEEAFLKQPQSDLNRLRLGYISDTSYIGRGNGKSAFLVNLMRKINQDYCLDISNDLNKCFALYVTPEPGGRTKRFASFVDLLFSSILQSKIINTCLALIRLDAIIIAYPDIDVASLFSNEEELIHCLSSPSDLSERGIEPSQLTDTISENEFLQVLPPDFPLSAKRRGFLSRFITEEDFINYFKRLKNGKEKIDFIFSHMVYLFMAAGFNGAYILVDDFERIPDFQSGRDRKDFAIELRSCLLDGPYVNARYGFYNMFLVLHAGVPQLIVDAWSSSGLGNRYPLMPKVDASHLVIFDKLNREHISMLLKKYLSTYRLEQVECDDLAPFTPAAVSLIAEINENNAAGILMACRNLLEYAANDPSQTIIDEDFIRNKSKDLEGDDLGKSPIIDASNTTDLMKKATEK
ncbi:MAG: hypothetical protein SWH61_05085 [Thermodesulfobacteriota bacterium]|nr:hypothetical protein [Thermodesulfobacteriota bacterium]